MNAMIWQLDFLTVLVLNHGYRCLKNKNLIFDRGHGYFLLFSGNNIPEFVI